MARPAFARGAAALVLLLSLAVVDASAQTTDGYHSIQVFPVVVDSASFVQRFTFRNPDPAVPITIAATYYPGTGLAQTTPTTCTPVQVPANRAVEVSSLRTLCPGIAAGSAYGFLYTAEDGPGNQVYAAFSRVSNIAGAGFSVEGFPPHVFTSADTVVSGLRRVAATGSTPAYQTNCFIGNINQVNSPASSVQTEVAYALYDSAGAMIGSASSVVLVPGRLTRLLDVFASVGAPAGNFENVRILFQSNSAEEPGLMTFCTVQDNTSFGADFRIGKVERGYTTQYSGLAAQDDGAGRDTLAIQDVYFSGVAFPRQFDIPGGLYSNTHVIYFRHPDRIQCELVDLVANARLPASAGLEMRLLDQEANLVAGGDNVTGFGEIYLGDKNQRNFGANSRYTLEVESSNSGPNAGTTRSYGIHCQSGSGHTVPDIVRYHDPVTRF